MQMLRNKPIRISRDKENLYLYVQGPTIGEIQEDEKLFLAGQMLMMQKEDLKELIQMENDKLSSLEMITLVLTKFEDKDIILKSFQKLILGLKVEKNRLFVEEDPLTEGELIRIKQILLTIMGQKPKMETEEKDLTPEEIRMRELEKKVQSKKKEKEEIEGTDEKQNMIEDIMVAVIYEFGFSIEQIMNMNYFTLIWYYSYTGKLHVYRINQHAIGSGMVKKINTDYFTSLK
jgi:hypothetical protein